jgi:thymidylate synthase (FAD)
MEVTLIEHMGDDLMVVNAARVSFHKESDWDFDAIRHLAEHPPLKEADQKLLNYLARNKHWTPFSHPQACFRIKAPIFVARQLFKHKVGMTENEVSRRYVDDAPEFYVPTEWRGRPVHNKQGSDGVADCQNEANTILEDIHSMAEVCYSRLLDYGVAPEQARMILPQSMYTEWYWTGSLASFARICKLRLDPHAQAETREIAEAISEKLEPLFPQSWKALMND